MIERDKRKEREKLQRMNEIIEITESLFSKKGYNGFTMDEVAKEAGFTKKTVYSYFKSKDHLFLAIVLKGIRICNSMIDKELSRVAGKPGMEKIRVLARVFIEFSYTHKNYFKAVCEYENREEDFVTDDPITVLCYKEGEHGLGLLQQSIMEGIDDGSIKPGIDGQGMAIILWSMIMGMLNMMTIKALYIRSYHKKDPKELIDEALLIITAYLTNAGPDKI